MIVFGLGVVKGVSYSATRSVDKASHTLPTAFITCQCSSEVSLPDPLVPLTTTVTHENMVKRPPTPPSPEDSQFFTVVNPYPAQPYLTMEDSKIFARWIACIVGEDNLLSFHYKPKVSLL